MCFNARMTLQFDTIALIGKYQSPDVAGSVLAIASFLRERGHGVLLEQGTASAIDAPHHFERASFDEIGTRAHLVAVVGGDGTMLNTARRLASSGVPLVGVNLGRLGFLTDVARDEAIQQLGEILRGNYVAEDRAMLATEVIRNDERVMRTLAFNDVVVSKGELGRMIEFNVLIDGDYVYTQRSDGMIVTTPTGSTAYSLSANGPILHPGVAALALVPLCPHALTARPVTLPDTCTIDIVLQPPHDARVHFDGQVQFEARAGDIVRVTRAPYQVRLLHPHDYNYFAMLREKLHWSASPRL